MIRIENLSHQSFNLMIDWSAPRFYGWSGPRGKWRTLSQGVIAYNLGYTERENSAGTLSTYHLLLYARDDAANGWILRLNDYGDFWSDNDAGEGLLVESATIAFKGDYIKWEVVKMPDVS